MDTEKEVEEGWGATPPATPSTPNHASSPGVSRRKASISRSDSAVSLRIRELELRTSAGENGRSAPGTPSTPRAAARSAAAAADAGLAGKVTAADVFSMAKQGDEVAVRVVEETCDYLGLACVNICRILDPDAILLTGGLSKAEGLVDKVRAAALACLLIVDRRTERLPISAWVWQALLASLRECILEVYRQRLTGNSTHAPNTAAVVLRKCPKRSVPGENRVLLEGVERAAPRVRDQRRLYLRGCGRHRRSGGGRGGVLPGKAAKPPAIVRREHRLCGGRFRLGR